MRTIIDTDNMSVAELTAIITELRAIRKRKEQAENFVNRMSELIEQAKEAGFVFIDKDCGTILSENDFTLYDER